MRTLMLSILVTILLPGSAPADDAREAKAKEVLELMGARELFSESIDNTVDVQINQNPSLTPLRESMHGFFSRYMSWDSLGGEAAAEAADGFTSEELDAIAAFYRTPAGHKSLELPRILGHTAELGAKRVGENKAELEAILTERVRELRKKAEENP